MTEKIAARFFICGKKYCLRILLFVNDYFFTEHSVRIESDIYDNSYFQDPTRVEILDSELLADKKIYFTNNRALDIKFSCFSHVHKFSAERVVLQCNGVDECLLDLLPGIVRLNRILVMNNLSSEEAFARFYLNFERSKKRILDITDAISNSITDEEKLAFEVEYGDI